ncbi:hypothetical protein EXIGLDRAFT_737431 [Exidia glandulosa HHB12029]|uniref:Proteasome activator PA28 C-terminal domain-containing protein n=1 Tax=Exidia glandulosa HHB12029 TaxID=1314781 RepID=A0A166AQA8_EXIGL|nr:hypothetical protein EXIGLDRAFT_737431 [Exidia glandulosa HHB12029]
MRNTICAYHTERLKLASTFPTTAGLDAALNALDDRHLATIRQNTADLLSFYVVLVDALQTYYDQVRAPLTEGLDGVASCSRRNR